MFTYFAKLQRHHQVLFAVIVGTAVVFFWRGVWGFLDYYLFPNDMLLSYSVSFALGLIVLFGSDYTMQRMV
ncbi:MAG: hypothetical protein ABH854_05965 [Candidatus Diapherotrites archaeon]|nr:hypothetical protein [Candidatus Micrarchaeota archaeon]MBU1939744.1 hypothetical protein [Candidatus Micrarchaeota archaeon]